MITKVAIHDISVCIEGESGTGKELVAARIHDLSSRKTYPMVSVNCGAIPESLVEAEFFGHEKGAFTGAHQHRPGKFELANNGTLFLDEISELSPHAQQCLLRVIQEEEVTRIGGRTSIPVDVRIIAATNRPLKGLVRRGAFREDLYYRLATITLVAPPLRDRSEDIPALVAHFLRLHSIKLNRNILDVSRTFMQQLMVHSWPGNVRELDHTIARSAVLCDHDILDGIDFVVEPHIHAPGEDGGEGEDAAPTDGAPFLDRSVERAKRKESRSLALRRALEAHHGNKTRAARALGISRKTLYEWLRECAVESISDSVTIRGSQ